MSLTDLPVLKSRRGRWAFLILLASLPLLGWWTYGLFDLDEGFYAAVAGSMIRHHEWITPLYNGHPWFEKPILLYWLAKPSIILFGQAFGPRVPSALATVGTYSLVAWFGRRHFGPLGGVLSLFIVASSLLVVAIGRMLLTDALLLFFFTAAILAYWESLVGDRRWRLITAACLGFGVLTKGPVAILLWGLIALYAAVFHFGATIEDRGSVKSMPRAAVWALGVVILLAVISVWYVPAYLANGQTFIQEFLIKQNIGRFTGGDSAHTLPLYKSFWYYIPVLLAGMFPWILWLPAAWPKRSPESGARSGEADASAPQASANSKASISPRSELRKYLAAWAVIVFLFFTLSGAKLVHYVLPCCPPIALLVGSHLCVKWRHLHRLELRPKLLWMAAWLIACWMIVQGGFEIWYISSGQAEAHQMARYIASSNRQGWGVATYQLSRRDKDKGTGGTKLLETTLPSISFYVDRDVIETDDLGQIQAGGQPTWIFTRAGRLEPSPAIDLKREGKHYAVFLFRGTANPGSVPK